MHKTFVPRVLLATGACLSLLSGCGPVPTLSQLIMRPGSNIKATPETFGYDYEQVTVPVADGREVVIWYIPSQESKALVVVVPGSSSNKSYYAEACPLFVDDGYDVILMDYEGYGQSPGVPSLQNAVDDAMAVTNYAFTRHNNVVLFGASLGSPSATYAASQLPVKGLILEGSLILSQEAALWLKMQRIDIPLADAMAGLYTSPQIPDAFNILKYIALVDKPKLIMHSTDDTVTPFAGGQEVYNAAKEPKTFYQMKYDHGQMIRMDPDAYSATVRGWLDTTLGFPNTVKPAATQPAAGT